MINKSSKFKITKTSQASLLGISRSSIYRKPKTREESKIIKDYYCTANLFGNKRYMNGGATNPDFAVLARGGAQVKTAIDATC